MEKVGKLWKTLENFGKKSMPILALLEVGDVAHHRVDLFLGDGVDARGVDAARHGVPDDVTSM